MLFWEKQHPLEKQLWKHPQTQSQQHPCCLPQLHRQSKLTAQLPVTCKDCIKQTCRLQAQSRGVLTPWLSLRLGSEEKYHQAPLLAPENVQEAALFLLQSRSRPQILCQRCLHSLSAQTQASLGQGTASALGLLAALPAAVAPGLPSCAPREPSRHSFSSSSGPGATSSPHIPAAAPTWSASLALPGRCWAAPGPAPGLSLCLHPDTSLSQYVV